MSGFARMFALLVALITLGVGISFADCDAPPMGYEDYVYKLSTTPLPDTLGIYTRSDGGSYSYTKVSKYDRFIVTPLDTREDYGPMSIRYVCLHDNWVQVGENTLTLTNLPLEQQPSQLPPMYTAHKGETIRLVAKNLGIEEDSLKAWNPTDRKSKQLLYNNERVFTARPQVPIRRWLQAGGDKCTIPIEDQVWKLHQFPPDVQEEFHSLIVAGSHDVATIIVDRENPVIMDGLVYANGVVWDETAVLCINVDSLDADRWGPVDRGQIRYWLYRFHVCNNGAPDHEVLPRQEAQLTVKETSSPLTPPPPAEPIAEVIPTPIKKPHQWNENGVLWVTLEHVDVIHGDTQNNAYCGAEWVVRPWADEYGRLGLVLRGSPANYFDMSRDDRRTYSANYRFGLRRKAFEAGSWGGDIEGGGYYDVGQSLYVTQRRLSETHFRNETRAAVIDGYGFYARPLIYGPSDLYAEGIYRQGNNLNRHLGASLTVEPKRLYFAAMYDNANTRKRSRRIDTQQISTVPADFRTMEGRLGFEIVQNVTLYGAWNDWDFTSKVWNFRRTGPGAGERWYITSALTQWFDFKYFTYSRDYDPNTGQEWHNRQWRAAIGLVYGW